jgi:hypothetical protein
MARDNWRLTDAVEVPDVVGLHISVARQIAYEAGLKLAQPDPDGPPLAALTWPGDFIITGQSPAAGARLWRWDPLVVSWVAADQAGPAGDREPRRPPAPPVPPGEQHADPARSWTTGGGSWHTHRDEA